MLASSVKKNKPLAIILGYFIFILFLICPVMLKAQEASSFSGVILSSDSTLLLRDIQVLNLNQGRSTISDHSGFFSISCRIGNSLMFRHEDWEVKLLIIKSLKDSIFLTKKNIILDEVVIMANRPNMYLKDLQQLAREQNRKNGIYYGGRPPIALLSPFGGQPITFFYELLSKNGRKARKMESTIQKTMENSEVDRIFSTAMITSVVPIAKDDILLFKENYKPSMEQLRSWSTYDLHLYIKQSFELFVENNLKER